MIMIIFKHKKYTLQMAKSKEQSPNFRVPQQSMILKYQNTRDHSAWTSENRDPMHEVCIPQRIPRANVKQEEEAGTRIIVRNMERRNVGTKGKVLNKA